MVGFFAWFFLSLLLGSIIEWIIHKYFMHTTLWLPVAVERHAVKHHSERRAPGKFTAQEGELVEYHLFETSAMPIIWMLHFPIFGLVYLGWGPWASFGCALGTAAYVIAYELLHWYIHCPDKFWFKNAGWFKFLSEHHRRHHHRSKINYNVVLPLADVLFRTMSFEEVRPEPEKKGAGVSAGERSQP